VIAVEQRPHEQALSGDRYGEGLARAGCNTGRKSQRQPTAQRLGFDVRVQSREIILAVRLR